METEKPKTFRTIFWAALCTVVVTLLAVWAFASGCPSKTLVLTHTDTLIKIVPKLEIDTVLKWKEKIVYKEAKPDTIVLYKDSIRPDTIWGRWPEAIINLEKRGNRLTLSSLTPADTWNSTALVKDYIYNNVGNNFSIATKGQGFFVKTVHPFWTKFHGGLAVDGGFKLWGDSTMPFVDPRVRGYIGWGLVTVGPTITLHGIQLSAEIGWSF